MADGSFPAPLALESKASTLAAYSTVADELGFKPGDLIRERLVEFCRTSGIPVYDLAAVEAHMSHPGGDHPTPWNWVPLRERDVQAKPSPYWEGRRLLGLPYSRLVPVEHLRHAVEIQGAFPEARFFVAASADPDPFIAAWVETMRDVVVFGVWDEPGFGEAIG